MAEGDAGKLRDTAHAYKGTVTHFAAEESRQLASQLETLGKNGNLADAKALAEALQQSAVRLAAARRPCTAFHPIRPITNTTADTAATTSAMRTGEVSVVTPFRYTRLVFALILGVLVFHERPDAATLIGSAIVVGAGIYTLLRTRRTHRSPSRERSASACLPTRWRAAWCKLPACRCSCPAPTARASRRPRRPRKCCAS